MGRHVYIQNICSGLVLDIEGGTSEKEGKIIVYPYHGGANQLWEIQGHTIRSILNGLVMDIKGPSSQGSKIITWPHHGKFNQEWHFDCDDTIRGGNGLVLDIEGAKLVAGTPVIAWAKNNGSNQKWRVVDVAKESHARSPSHHHH